MAHPSLVAGSKEKRRYVRQATLQTARIRVGDGEAIAVEIRDYCPTGLYAAFLGADTPDAAIFALAGTSVLVEFGGGNTSGFRFKGRVARVDPSGMSVFVLAMPEGALQALRKMSVPLARAQPADAGKNADSPQAQALKQDCIDQFRSFCEAVMQEFFQRAEEGLSEAGLEALSFLDRSRFDYGAQELALHHDHIEVAFFNAMRDRIQNVAPLLEVPGKPPSTGKRTAKNLALVDEDEFEDWLNLSAVIKQIEAGIALELDVFEQRYGRLTGLPIDRKNNPFGPEAMGRAFQDAIRVLEFTNPMRAVLYKMLGQAISSRSTAFYPQLNLTLVSLQPAEPLRSSLDSAQADSAPAPAAASATHATETAGAAPDLAEISDTLNALTPQDQASASRSPDSAEYSLDHILAALGQSQRRATGGVAGAYAPQTGRRGDTSIGQAATRSEIWQVVRQLQQSARQLGRGDQVFSPHGQRIGESEARAEASLGELNRALDRLPLMPAAAQTSPAARSLADQIDASMVSVNGTARYLAPEHRRILDTTSGLLDRAWVDLAPSSHMEALVKRLERPLLKLALQDPGFPAMPDHPARQVLDLIEQFAVAADDSGNFFDAKLKRFLFLLVDRVCNRAEVDAGIFEAVRVNLEKVLVPILHIRRTRIARLQEACEGRERIRSARTRVNAALEQRLAGRDVPAILLRLLDAGWRQHLVLLEMRQGAQGEAWDAGLAVMDQLLDRLDGAHEAGSRTPVATGVLLGEIERTLKTVNVDANLLAAFMDELGAYLSDQGDSSGHGHTMVRVPPGRLAAAEGAQSMQASRLRVGDWWDLSVEGHTLSMQLIWASRSSQTSAFTNRSATRKLELSLPELARQIQSGLAKPGKDMDIPVIERSENALFDETYQDLMQQVLHDPTTGLLNRKGFIHHLNGLGMPEQADKTHAVGIIEFDQFRMIYNVCGMDAVERLTRSLADAVREQVGADAVLASFRDDTLAILLPNCSRAVGCEAIELLLAQVKNYHFQHEAQSYSIGFNLGVAEYSPVQVSAVEVLRRADSACITAKLLGRNRMQIYEETSPQLQSEESMMGWAGRIDTFLTGNGLHLRCQQVMPIGADTPLLPHYEVLLGIEGEDGRGITPMQFIPAIERLQRAHEIDIWVIRNVFDWIGANREKFDSLGGLAINLSATSLNNPEIMRFLQEVLPASDFPTHKITFEITETAAIGSYGAAQDFIRDIRRYGCKFALDDFGSGFTSYAHLKNLRTDSLKIDGSFVKDMLNNPGDYAMVKSMNDIGHSLGLRTIAEYVESPEILEALREIGVDYAQGYAIHMPCRIDEIVRYEPV